MPKTTEVPVELREFNRLFDDLSYTFNYSDSFSDFLDYSVACFLLHGDKMLAERLEVKYSRRYPLFAALLTEWIVCVKKQLEHREWYDLLGTYYQILSSSSKASALGQFFTPPDLCDLLAQFQMEAAPATVSDPCSGSGRLILAAKVLAPAAKFYAADVDPMCTKMTALNMAIHGCQGQAVCMNSLGNDDSWRFGFEINPFLFPTGVPHLDHLEKSRCKQRLRQSAPAASPGKPVTPPDFVRQKSSFSGQMSIF